MELHNEPDCERLELLLVRRHIEHCETCRVELTNLLLSDSQGEPQRRESDENMSEDEWKRLAALRSESVRRHSTYVTKLGETVPNDDLMSAMESGKHRLLPQADQ
jgi:hypothetical protein